MKGPHDPLAIIDIGSNSARLVIYHPEVDGQLRILGSMRQPLRLVREVDRNRRLSAEAIAGTLRTLADFRSMIRAYGAHRIVAVATAAMRDADNAKEILRRARAELGLRIELIDAAKEAYFGCVGGIRALPVDSGIVFDLGGGSVQLIQFQGRRPGTSWSLPLGSLRLSEAFIRHDPPTKREVRTLQNYVQRKLAEVSLPRLTSQGALVGVGGTIRNLAKVDVRLQDYPIARIHGYTLRRENLARIVDLLCHKPIRSDKRIAGLSRDREDSIVGGALAIDALVAKAGASEILVSGQGVREGLAFSQAGGNLPSSDSVREAALLSLATRFKTWDLKWAGRRKKIVSMLLRSLAPKVHDAIKTAAEQAAFLLDIGRSVDFFDRYRHAAMMVIDTELDGFSHLQITLLSAIISNAVDDSLVLQKQILKGLDHDDIKRAAVLLKLSDDMLQHWPRNLPIDFDCRVARREVRISGPGFDGLIYRGINSRFERLFNRRLVVECSV